MKAERYAEAITFITSAIENLKDSKNTDALIINRELSKKHSNIKIDEVAIRNIISRANNEEAILCAHILLDHTNSHRLRAEETLKNYYDNDCVTFLMFRQWPAIPSHYLSKYLNALNTSTEKNHGDLIDGNVIAMK